MLNVATILNFTFSVVAQIVKYVTILIVKKFISNVSPIFVNAAAKNFIMHLLQNSLSARKATYNLGFLSRLG